MKGAGAPTVERWRAVDAFSRAEPATYPLGRLERFPKWLNLVPMVVQWLYLAMRYGSATLPSAANPAITSGGLVGEGKSEYFAIMGSHARAMTADSTVIENTGANSIEAVEAVIVGAGLQFPLIVKPDIGWCGFGVRLVADRAELLSYLDRFPRGEAIVVQRFISHEGEAGLFYVRHPGQTAGQITGMLLRTCPRVIGDGVHTIGALIAANRRLRRLGRDGLSEPCCDPSRVPAHGEIVRVTIIGSTRVGALYRDATALVTPALTAAVDTIAKDMKDLHVARFDVRYESLEALCAGRDFKIIEVNGAGSEAVHAWDPALNLRQAFSIVFAKQRMIFAIGDAMRREGHKPIDMLALARLHLRQQKLIKRYPPSN